MGETTFPDALPPQYRLHWYVFERVLGQGGFGITYLARDTNLDQPVAIKEFLPVEVATRLPDATVRSRTEEQHERFRVGLERFIREARTLARFDHANIVRVHSVFESNNTAYMVMRFEEGETLAALLERRHALPEEELTTLLLRILDGLELVHNAGFIHRDIKPDNIHIRTDGSPVLLDFGSARYALGHSRTLTILVAPGYAPFEQYYSDGGNQGPWTDIYGLAATCYRAIAGRAPLDAITRSKGILGSTKEVLVPAAVVGSGRYGERLLKAIDHALAFAEQERPQTIAEWRKELLGQPLAAGPAAAVPASPPASGSRFAWAGAGAAAALAIAALLVWMQPTPTPTTPPPPSPPVAPAKSLDADLAKAKADAERLREELARQQAEAATLKEQMAATAKPAPAAPPKPDPVVRARPAAPAAKPLPIVAPAPAAPPVAPAPAVVVEAAEAETPKPQAPKPEAPKPEAAKPEPPKPAAAPPAPAQGEQMASAEQAITAGNFAAALRTLLPLAERGNPEAQYLLGELYAGGRGVAMNSMLAYVWYAVAASGGHAGAKLGHARVAPLLQPAEREQADKVVANILARKGR